MLNMLIKFPLQMKYSNVYMLKVKELNSFATECVVPRLPKRRLPPLLEDKECNNTDVKKITRFVNHRRRQRRQWRLAVVPEYDEC